ncbi:MULTISPECIES: TetR-like C-terminal domain-containing protein [Streptomyces]|uniref:TetR family transcriptional regulator n=1 Tax=Streptomyces nigrescens TaxID=1920 RepID=A0A640TUR8_STRNI|nr:MULTISPECIES: TetR-like C-terminal domain-containing protein [Streptomyces]MCX5451654.1 TetR-like C-terminal domain-containing protein [Streptomyces libani]WAU01489.1 TetR family transcriptional regulator C-terminal domain-containing protein [Streptomyces libani subsp. libani]GFE27437.1 TetR family transcriptional regulator [Streptomyces libani subsp. libani]GGV96144.1 TetR family transcriptional regulator [Streptomyces libani subsp. libani]
MPVQQSDRRSRRSRTAMESALLELIGDRDLSQISVSDVTGRADVHRSTFYEHYTDVHDLAASACTEMFDQLLSATSALSVTGDSSEGDSSKEGSHPSLTAMFAHVAEHRALYEALLGADGSARVINHLLQRMTESIRPRLSAQLTDSEGGTDDSAAAFVSGALLGAIADWLHRGCPGTPERFATAIWPQLVAATLARPA